MNKNMQRKEPVQRMNPVAWLMLFALGTFVTLCVWFSK